MYQHAYPVRNPMHGTLNIQVSNSEGTVGGCKLFARDCVKGSSLITLLVITVHFLLALASSLPPQILPGAKRATDLERGRFPIPDSRPRNAPRDQAQLKPWPSFSRRPVLPSLNPTGTSGKSLRPTCPISSPGRSPRRPPRSLRHPQI